jgi:hypothetical protein
MSEEMLAITNKHALADDATLDSKDTKKDKESSQSDRPGTSKNNDKKRRPDRSVANSHTPKFQIFECD